MLSLQLSLWNKIPSSATKRANPEDYGQLDFNKIADWKGETEFVLSQVAKSGWHGVEDRAQKAKQRLRTQISRKANRIRKMNVLDRLSGERRKLLKEIKIAEIKLRGAELLATRVTTMKAFLKFG